jgi:hypothetical protein
MGYQRQLAELGTPGEETKMTGRRSSIVVGPNQRSEAALMRRAAQRDVRGALSPYRSEVRKCANRRMLPGRGPGSVRRSATRW